jgi:SAM-dependent methyltransferase
MKVECSFCGREAEKIYEPVGSKRGSLVFLCPNCGLVQTKYTLPYKRNYSAIKISCDADWGNIRYGKHFSLEYSKNLLENIVVNSKKILDIGSNRGTFVRFVSKINKNCKVFAVEPDANLINYENLALVFKGKFEDFDFDEIFDFIYCSHTLEHVDDLTIFLEKLHKVTNDDSTIFIEVPNIVSIKNSTVVEEFFIDKHTFHFHPTVLPKIFQSFGFEIIRSHIEEGYMWFLLKKGKDFDYQYSIDKNELYRYLVKLISNYKMTLNQNRKRLYNGVQKLVCNYDKVGFWGCGRIFDAIIKYGRFPKDKVYIAVDSYLPEFIDKVSGIPIVKPVELKKRSPEVLVIATRGFLKQIEREAKKYHPNLEVVPFIRLLNNCLEEHKYDV